MEKRIKTSTFCIGILFVFIFYLLEAECPDLVTSLLSAVFPPGLASIISSVLMVLLVYIMIYLVSTKILKLSMKEIGIPAVRIDAKWLIAGFALIAVVLGIYFIMPGQYGLVDSKTSQLDRLLISIAVAILAGINEELIFRGLFMHIMKYRFNIPAAIIIPSFLFASVHLFNGQLDPAGIIMLLAGGTSVGCMFSMIALTKDSIWNSAIVHAIWDLFIGGIFIVANEPTGEEIIYKKIDISNPLITGGGFGIDCSVICIICFVIVFVIAYKEYKREQPGT
jgi:membrane protease YdiL (CAAX protease family)